MPGMRRWQQVVPVVVRHWNRWATMGTIMCQPVVFEWETAASDHAHGNC